MYTLTEQISNTPTATRYILAGTIGIMFFYAAFSKLYHYENNKRNMLRQVFPVVIALRLAWIIPLIELIICGLLLFKNTQVLGFYASACAMSVFSLYISISMTGIFGSIPCSCGGILRKMSYWYHLIFNLFFLAMSILGIKL